MTRIREEEERLYVTDRFSLLPEHSLDSLSIVTVFSLFFSGEVERDSLVVGHIWWKSDNLKHKHNQLHADLHVSL